MEQIVYLNKEFFPATQASISAFDHGFLYGDGLFETMRAYGGHIFLLDRHLGRLERSAKWLGIPLPPLDELTGALCRLLAVNGLKDASIRLTVSRGPGPGRPELELCGPPTVLAAVRPYAYGGEEAEKSLSRRRLIVSCIRRNDLSPLAGIKSLNYMDSLLAREEAHRTGADDAILLNTRGEIAETSTANIFFVQDQLILTPPIESGCLPGITRQVVLEIAQAMGFRALEKVMMPQDLLCSDEIFVTNSLIEVAPVQEVNGQRVHDKIPGPITRALAQAYREMVGTFCGIAREDPLKLTRE
ncbi:MAG: hypothetical protein HPY71_04130 [Firmicutes bacterium]|nr:hypothetical protein [Bacillota bacterium]